MGIFYYFHNYSVNLNRKGWEKNTETKGQIVKIIDNFK